eukprot:Nitzschia sp. Nitz4//scaffold37_size175936//92195//92905//NITZ4_002050-RA/size175936-processed-gene-0.191-mRNA-1//1//CDS//3329549800//5771//frame0
MMTDPCALNNLAVQCLCNSDYDESISTLTKALRSVKAVMSGESSLPRDSPCDAQAMDTDNADDSTGYQCNFVSFECTASFQKTLFAGSTRTLFRDPIYMTASNALDQMMVCEVASYAILYNLALSYHLKGMTMEDTEERLPLLRKGLTLYEHAHHILSSKVLDVSLIHAMAIASNLGHIHHLLRDETRSRLCFQHLLSTIVYVVNCGQFGEHMVVPDGFFSNVMPLLGTGGTAPAA